MTLDNCLIHNPISISIVSHGQGELVRKLLCDIRHWKGGKFEIILTFNIPENEEFVNEYSDLNIIIIRNSNPKGFGANHNAALLRSKGDIFVVVNPDIRGENLDFAPLLETVGDSGVGACAPLVLSINGNVEDSARRFPTFFGLLRRLVIRNRVLESEVHDVPTVVDWVAGMFIVFPKRTFLHIGGFDERYFMYMEDVDICRRLKNQGYLVVFDPRCAVQHDARRASRKNFKHFSWHVRSTIRYLFRI